MRIRHRYIASKMRKTYPLMHDRRVSRHIPEIVWYSDSHLIHMLHKWGLVYVKPDTGSGGTGIIRIARRKNFKHVVSWGRRKVVCETRRLPAVVKTAMLRGKSYVIQRGIHMAKVNGKPFDLRIVWQRPGKSWQLTWMSAKIATRRGATVTNVAKRRSGRPDQAYSETYDTACPS